MSKHTETPTKAQEAYANACEWHTIAATTRDPDDLRRAYARSAEYAYREMMRPDLSTHMRLASSRGHLRMVALSGAWEMR